MTQDHLARLTVRHVLFTVIDDADIDARHEGLELDRQRAEQAEALRGGIVELAHDRAHARDGLEDHAAVLTPVRGNVQRSYFEAVGSLSLSTDVDVYKVLNRFVVKC